MTKEQTPPPIPVYSPQCREDMSAPPVFRLPATVDPRDASAVADVAIGFADATNTWARSERPRVNACAEETRRNADNWDAWVARERGDE